MTIDSALHVLLIEDNAADALVLQEVLAQDPLSRFGIVHVERLWDGIELSQQAHFDIVLLDLNLPDSCGIATFETFHRQVPALPVVVFSGNVDQSDAIQAVRLGAQDYLVKGVAALGVAGRVLRYAVERQRVQTALHQSEARFHQVMDAMLEGCQIISYDWHYLYLNQAAARHARFPVQQMIGRTMMEIYPGIETTSLFACLRTCMETRQAVRFENQFTYPDGIQSWFELSVQPAEQGLFILSSDISERKRAEESLQVSERNLKLFVEYAPAAIAMFDRDMKYIAASQRYMADYRLPLDNPVGYSHYDVFPEIPDRWKEIHRRCLAGATERADEDPFPRQDGSVDWVKWEILPWHEASGQIGGLILFSEVVTERKQAELELRSSNERFTQLADYLPEIFWISDPVTRQNIYVSPAFETIVGLSPEAVSALPGGYIDILHPDDRLILQEARRQEALGFETDIRYRIRRPDGSLRWMRDKGVPIRDENGQVVRIVGIAQDLTRQIEAEIALRESEEKFRRLSEELEERVRQRTAELSRAYAAVETASRSKDEFLANMSHELRTPLSGILGITEILLTGYRGALNDDQERLVRMVDTSGRHLLSLINDILDLSKIEAGRLDIYPEMVSINDICQSSLVFIKGSASKKGLFVEYVSDPRVTTILVDARRLKQILVNLLSNAVKFTPANGRVSLQVKLDLSRSVVDLSVVDTGIGIAPDDLRRLFTPFTQVDSSLTREFEGTGLGLALVKRLVELHGGSITVSSEVNRGSCFTVSLPWHSSAGVQDVLSGTDQAASLAPPPAAAAGSLETLLLADDTEASSIVIGTYLERVGYRMVYAVNGRDALEKAAEFSPALILMDIQMPELDGLEAIRRMRQDQRFTATPIIALTALAMPGDRQRCLDAGASEYISKPVRLRQLYDLIRSLLDVPGR